MNYLKKYLPLPHSNGADLANALGIVIGEHTIGFRTRVITEPEVVQHRITNPSVAIPPGNATP